MSQFQRMRALLWLSPLVLLGAALLTALPCALAGDDPVPDITPSGKDAGETGAPAGKETGSDGTGAPKDAAGERGDTAVKKGAAASGIPVVKVTSKGRPPYRVLRYAPQPNSRLIYKITGSMQTKTPMGTMKIGPVKVEHHVHFVRDSGAAAQAPFRLRLETPTVEIGGDPNNQMLAPLRAPYEKLKAAKHEIELSTAGIPTSDPLKPGASSIPDLLAGHLRSMILALPAEEIGVGATWTTTGVVGTDGLRMKLVRKVELIRLVGQRMDVRWKETYSARNGKMNQGGVVIKIPKADGEGTGSGTVDLALGGVIKSTLSNTSKMQGEMMGMLMETTSESKESLSAMAPEAVTKPKK